MLRLQQEEGESSKTQENQKTQKRKRKPKTKTKKKEKDNEKPGPSGCSSSSSSSASKTTSVAKSPGSDASHFNESSGDPSSVKVTAVKDKANGKQFIKERPKLPPSTLRNNNNDDSDSDDNNNNNEDVNLSRYGNTGGENKFAEEDMPTESATSEQVPISATSEQVPISAIPPRYPKREGQPRINYSEAEVPDDDHYICKFHFPTCGPVIMFVELYFAPLLLFLFFLLKDLESPAHTLTCLEYLIDIFLVQNLRIP